MHVLRSVISRYDAYQVSCCHRKDQDKTVVLCAAEYGNSIRLCFTTKIGHLLMFQLLQNTAIIISGTSILHVQFNFWLHSAKSTETFGRFSAVTQVNDLCVSEMMGTPLYRHIKTI